MEKYLSIDEMLERDKNISQNISQNKSDEKNKIFVFQIQSEKNKPNANLICVGKHETCPIVLIFKKTVKNITDGKKCKLNCQLLSFTNSFEDIIENELKMIGFLIFKKNKIISSLILSFIPNEKINDSQFSGESKNITDISGHFEISCLKGDKIGDCDKSIIKKFDIYPGREESVHLMTETLAEFLN